MLIVQSRELLKRLSILTLIGLVLAATYAAGLLQRDFEVVQMQDVVVKPVYTSSFTAFYDYATRSWRFEGRETLVALPYMLGRVPFIVLISIDYEAEKVRVELYHVLARRVIDAVEIDGLSISNIPYEMSMYYYITGDNSAVITLPIYKYDRWLETLFVKLYKVAIIGAHIKEVRNVLNLTLHFNSDLYRQYIDSEGFKKELFAVFEGLDGDYVFGVFFDDSDRDGVLEGHVALFGPSGSIIGETIVPASDLHATLIYETRDYVIFGAGVGNSIVMYKYDKAGKVVKELGVMQTSVYPSSEVESIAGGYYENIVMIPGTEPIWVWFKELGDRYATLSRDTGIPHFPGFIRGDKILLVGESGTYPNLWQDYKLFSYTIQDGVMHVNPISFGMMWNYTILLYGNGTWVGILLMDRYVEVLGLDRAKYIPSILLIFEEVPKGSRRYSALVIADIQNYKVSFIPIYDDVNVRYVVQEGGVIKYYWKDYYTPHVRAKYHPRFAYLACVYEGEAIIGNYIKVTQTCTVYIFTTSNYKPPTR